MRFLRYLLIAVLFVCSSVAHAKTLCEKFLIEASAVASYSGFGLTQGEPVKIQFGEDSNRASAVFLGRLIGLQDTSPDLLFYEQERKLIHIIPIQKLSIQRRSGESISAHDSSPIVRSENQEGGTCAAYSIFNCLRQLHYTGRDGNGTIAKQIETESGRQHLLVRLINEIYLKDRFYEDVLSEVGKQYGFKFREVLYRDSLDLKKKITKSLRSGSPVMLRFDTNFEMATTPFTVLNHADGVEAERKMWMPRTSRKKAKLGHMVFALGIVEVEGIKKILISDSNWKVPRLWDLSAFDKPEYSNISAYVVSETRRR